MNSPIENFFRNKYSPLESHRQISEPTNSPFDRFWPTLPIAFISVGIVSILLFALSSGSDKFLYVLSVGALIAIASAALGTLLGFLFGIPKTAKNSNTKTDNENTQVALSTNTNTNLEDISDWLTKILVGVGLTQASKVPGLFDLLTSSMAQDIPITSAKTFLICIVFYHVIVGFFLGYVFTRTQLSAAFSQFETELTRIHAQKLQIQNLVRTLTLKLLDVPDEPEDSTDPHQSDDGQKLNEQDSKQIDEILNKINSLPQFSLDGKTYSGLAKILRYKGDYREAIRAYKQAFALDPSLISSLNSAAVLHSKYLNEYRLAENIYKQILVIDPEYATAYFNLACTKSRLGDSKSAVEYLRIAAGYKSEYVQKALLDDAFTPIRQTEEFTKFMEENKQNS